MLVSFANRLQTFATRMALISMIALPSQAFGVDLFFENFESVPLGPVVTIQTQPRDRNAWSPTFPQNWAVDNSLMPPGVVGDDTVGVTEFEGWTVVDKNWWVNSEDQGRSGFINGVGAVAVADSDEHDDLGDPDSLGPYDSTLTTPSIALGGAGANTVNLSFHSSWIPEGNQKATITARYNNGANVEVLSWNSLAEDPLFHPEATNELVSIPLQNPAGASSVTLDFHYFDAANNWFWALDNLRVFTGSGSGTDGVLRAIIDRTTSNVKIVNNTGAAVDLRGYSIESAAGAFNEANATFLADSDPNWVQLTNPNTGSDLSEGHLDTGSLANGGTINFGDNVWRKYFADSSDVTFQYLSSGDDPITGIVEFTGNGDESYQFLDLNFNGAVEIGDWDAFRAGFDDSLTGLSAAQRYQLGDLDNDGQHTAFDFQRFQSEYDAALGAGAFQLALAASQVPEPGTGVMLLSAVFAFVGFSTRRSFGRLMGAVPAAVALVVVLSASTAQAQLTFFFENFESLPLGPSVEEQNADDNVWTDTPPAGWVIDDSGIPGVNEPPENNGMYEWAGWAFTDKVWWSTEVDGQLRETFDRANGTVMVADPDEWDDQDHPGGDIALCNDVNPCLYDALVTTKSIPIPSGIPAGTVRLTFDSSWRDEWNDDSPIFNNQTATVKAIYNGGTPIEVLKWDSDPGSPTFHDDNANEAVNVDLQYDGVATELKLQFSLTEAENDWFWAVDNLKVFVPTDPSILRVNTTTGQVSIKGGDSIPVPINFIDIQSANGALNGSNLSGLSTSKPDSVDGPDGDSTVGNSSGETWQVLSQTDTRVSEAFLFGNSDFDLERTINLGSIFDTSTLEANRDITFTYSTPFNDVITGIVEYYSTPGVAGDYNSNGIVDAADYVVWRDNLGKSVTLPNDSTPGTVTQADYTLWKTNFGSMAGSGSLVGAAVPEPASAQLAFIVLLVAVLGCARSRRLSLCPALVRAGAWGAVGLGFVAGFVESASAQLPPPPVNDRYYQMGDDDTAPVNGGNVSITRDSTGMSGVQQIINLSAKGNPKYELLPTTTGGAVPKRPDNGTGFAIRLNSTPGTQHLETGFEQALNNPEYSISSTNLGGIVNYEFIDDRGFQLWVLPSHLPTAGQQAHIVMDTNQHGVLINGNGNFAMRYASPEITSGDPPSDYDSGVPAVANTWYHLAVVRPQGPNYGSILYVNGRAVAAAVGEYLGESDPLALETTPLVVGGNTSNVAFQVGQQNNFRGLVDDLKMFALSYNNDSDYGEWVFERDNDYAAFFKPSNPVDLTNDNQLTSADIDVFVDNWLYENVLTWTQDGDAYSKVIGDLDTRLRGDFNYDGAVNLIDWEILNDANPAIGAAAMARISGAVPEPAAICLAALAAIGWGAAYRRPRTSN